MKLTKTDLVLYFSIFFTAYFMSSLLVFSFRHPWLTETQVFLNVDKALLFKEVKPEQLRGMYKL